MISGGKALERGASSCCSPGFAGEGVLLHFVTVAEARTLEHCLLPVDLLYLPFTRNLQQLHSYFRSTTVRYFLPPILVVALGKELQPTTAKPSPTPTPVVALSIMPKNKVSLALFSFVTAVTLLH
ncbi:hypothetical protein NN561_012487 [Cricetulus griseus]